MMMGPRNGGISAYEYRMDGNEVFTDSARIKPFAVLRQLSYLLRTHRSGVFVSTMSDIPSAEVKGYYLKESAYYDQRNIYFPSLKLLHFAQ